MTHVHPVHGRPLRVEPAHGDYKGLPFWVTSATNPDMRHKVELYSHGWGECGCAAYTCNHRKHELTHATPYRCKHIRAARDYFTDACIEKFFELQLAE